MFIILSSQEIDYRIQMSPIHASELYPREHSHTHTQWQYLGSHIGHEVRSELRIVRSTRNLCKYWNISRQGMRSSSHQNQKIKDCAADWRWELRVESWELRTKGSRGLFNWQVEIGMSAINIWCLPLWTMNYFHR